MRPCSAPSTSQPTRRCTLTLTLTRARALALTLTLTLTLTLNGRGHAAARAAVAEAAAALTQPRAGDGAEARGAPLVEGGALVGVAR